MSQTRASKTVLADLAAALREAALLAECPVVGGMKALRERTRTCADVKGRIEAAIQELRGTGFHVPDAWATACPACRVTLRYTSPQRVELVGWTSQVLRATADDVDRTAAITKTGGKAPRKRRRTTTDRPLTEQQLRASQLYAENHGDVSAVAEAMDISRQAAKGHIDAAMRKIPALARKTIRHSGVRPQRLPTDKRGQVDI